MPYIKDKIIRNQLDIIVAELKTVFALEGFTGNFNYFLFKLCKEVMKSQGENYKNYRDFLGELESAKLEIYRRLVAKYEEQKKEGNGDVN